MVINRLRSTLTRSFAVVTSRASGGRKTTQPCGFRRAGKTLMNFGFRARRAHRFGATRVPRANVDSVSRNEKRPSRADCSRPAPVKTVSGVAPRQGTFLATTRGRRNTQRYGARVSRYEELFTFGDAADALRFSISLSFVFPSVQKTRARVRRFHAPCPIKITLILRAATSKARARTIATDVRKRERPRPSDAPDDRRRSYVRKYNCKTRGSLSPKLNCPRNAYSRRARGDGCSARCNHQWGELRSC